MCRKLYYSRQAIVKQYKTYNNAINGTKHKIIYHIVIVGTATSITVKFMICSATRDVHSSMVKYQDLFYYISNNKFINYNSCF